MRDLTLRLGAAVAEVEALYAAMLDEDDPRQERALRAQLAQAARNLAVLAGVPAVPAPRRPMSRKARRAAVARGAAVTMARIAARNKPVSPGVQG